MGSWELGPCFPAGARPQSACPGLSSSPEVPGLASRGDGGPGGKREGWGAASASGQGGTEGGLPLPRPSLLPAGAARLPGEAGERLAEDTDPRGSLLGDRSDQQCTAHPPLGRGALSRVPQAHDGPGPGVVSPAYGPVAPPRGLRQGDPSLLLQPQRWGRGGGSEVLNGRKPVGKQAEAQPGLREAAPTGRRSAGPRPPFTLCTGGDTGFPETLHYECFPGSRRLRWGRAREAVHSPGCTRC